MYHIEYPKQLKKVEVMLPEELVSKIEDLVAYHQEAYPKAQLNMSIILEKVVEEALAISPTLEQWRTNQRPSQAAPKERRGPKTKAAKAAEVSNKAVPSTSSAEAAPASAVSVSATQTAAPAAASAAAPTSASSPSAQASGVPASKLSSSAASAQPTSPPAPVDHNKISAEMEKHKASQVAPAAPSTSGT